MNCFKAYDIRGRVPDELNDDIAYRIGRAYAKLISPAKVVVGHDIRLTSLGLSEALSRGLTDEGVDVFAIGECGTEEIYFATDHFRMDGGIVVTASHNPKDFNGMKLVRQNARPVSGDTGLHEIRDLVVANRFSEIDPETKGTIKSLRHRDAYVEKLLGYLDIERLAPLRIVVNAGNGGAGMIVDQLEPHLPFEFIKVHHKPDGNFPHGVPNPLLVENRTSTTDAILEHGADLGIAWDGDFDRCFFFDSNGRFIEGYYIVGLLAEAFLDNDPGEKIVHDPRLTWNTVDIVNTKRGTPIMSKTGHAFIKERMRAENAIYGGEMSAHHYFRDFAYCDSGMIPWLLVVGLMCRKGEPLHELVDSRIARFPASGEINRRIDNPEALLSKLENKYDPKAVNVDYTDGLSMSFDTWRFNVRVSNTEPVVRLNVESRANAALMRKKTDELLQAMGGDPV